MSTRKHIMYAAVFFVLVCLGVRLHLQQYADHFAVLLFTAWCCGVHVGHLNERSFKQ